MIDPMVPALEFSAEVSRLFGDRVVSVVLYGSVPRHESVPGVSDINLLIVLDAVGLEDLSRLGPAARRWVEAGNCSPLVFGREEFLRSTDVFAVELADMLDRREVLLGQDPVEGLGVDRSALRQQIEFELRSRLTQFREGLMLASPEPEMVGELLVRSVPTFLCYLRSILRLVDRDVPDASADVIRAAANLVGARPDAMLEAWEWRRRGEIPVAALADPITVGYEEFVRRTIEWVDATAPA